MSNRFMIGERTISDNTEPFIIAEAGINHNGDLSLAKKMIVLAKEAGADAVKFQTFKTEEFIQDKKEQYTYYSQGKKITESQYEMFKRTEFSREEWEEIKRYCDECQIVFLSTPSSEEGAAFLASIGVPAIKVSSDDFVNLPLLERYERLGLPMIVSCGMANEEEIRTTLETIKAHQGHSVCLMLCTSEYPTPPEDVNAAKLLTMKNRFLDVALGLSDHTQGSLASIVAVALGARVFEKHFTADHNLPGPDHWFSADPGELREWVDGIRKAFIVLGDPELKPTKTEEQQRVLMRRSITASTDIKTGEVLGEKNLILLRPGTGMGAEKWNEVEGKTAIKDIAKGKQIEQTDFH